MQSSLRPSGIPSPYQDPGKVTAILDKMTEIGIDFSLFPLLLPQLARSSAANNINPESAELVIAALTAAGSVGITLYWRPQLTRRKFLMVGSASMLLALAGCAPGAPAQPTEALAQNRIDECKDPLPPISEYADPVNLNEYNRMSDFEKVYFFRRGGYAREWTDNDGENFILNFAAAAKEAYAQVFPQIMGGESELELGKRMVLVGSKTELVQTLINAGFAQENAWSIANNTLGVSVDTGDGKQNYYLNLELENESETLIAGEKSDNQHYSRLGFSIANTLAHELNHHSFKPKPMTDEQKDEVKSWLVKLGETNEISEILDAKLGLEIPYKVQGQTPGEHWVLLKYGVTDATVDNDDIWSEIIRTYSQGEFDRRLQEKLGEEKRDFQNVYDLFYGSKMLGKFHEKLGLDKEDIINFYNSFRAEGDKRMLGNMYDLIKYYTESGKKKINGLTEVQVLQCLLAVKSETVKLVQRSDQYDLYRNINQFNSQAFDSYVCDLYDEYQQGIAKLQSILSGQNSGINSNHKTKRPDNGFVI